MRSSVAFINTPIFIAVANHTTLAAILPLVCVVFFIYMLALIEALRYSNNQRNVTKNKHLH